MINYVIYDDNGDLVQQGQGHQLQVEVLKKKLIDLYLLPVEDKITDLQEYQVVDGQLVARSQRQTTDLDYSFSRHHTYGDIGQQLDLLYKDIQAGLFGDSARQGQFANFISSVKQQYPKS
jgi:hypothetical protein